MADTFMTNRILRIHLASWRYFAALTLPPLGVAMQSPDAIMNITLWGLFLIVHYYCWRMWLDERLFRLINSEQDLSAFDDGMAVLWPVKKRHRPLEQRREGASQLFHRALWATGALWANLLIVLIVSA
ncbi:hypothetical protein [Atlantibacter hermannii]|uniref:hypothetical protein n=1 Tax=Atlantibacter hermannii TaxID=565 RepID=UPI0020733C76|nr:hypothetical protein [Atlantibacter hermannii]